MDIDQMFNGVSPDNPKEEKFIKTFKDSLETLNEETDPKIKELKVIISELHSFNLDICSKNEFLNNKNIKLENQIIELSNKNLCLITENDYLKSKLCISLGYNIFFGFIFVGLSKFKS